MSCYWNTALSDYFSSYLHQRVNSETVKMIVIPLIIINRRYFKYKQITSDWKKWQIGTPFKDLINEINRLLIYNNFWNGSNNEFKESHYFIITMYFEL